MKRWRPVAFLVALISCQIASHAGASAPLKTYENQVISRMQTVWMRLASQAADHLSIGTATILFKVAPNGRVYDLKVVSNTGNHALAEIARRTVQETRIPPIPP